MTASGGPVLVDATAAVPGPRETDGAGGPDQPNRPVM
jgi:hypothetical protein